MKRIEVHNQTEFDACVAAGNIAVVIDCHVVAWGSSRVVAWDSSSVVAWGNVFIRLFSCLKIKASLSVVILKHRPSEAIEGGRTLEIIEDVKSI